MKFFKLIRYQNLLMLAFMQLLFRYGFLKLQNIPLALSNFQFVLLVLSTVLIAAAGYIINNVYDQETDTINKPNNVVVGSKISENEAYTIYAILNCIGVGIGFYLSNVIERPSFASIFILIAATLYIYSTSLKRMLIIGNIVVAFLLSFSVIIIGVFDLFPATYDANQLLMGSLFLILLDYALFAFMINFIREIVKDLEDFNGDKELQMNTLPIYFGKEKTTKIVFALSFIPILLVLFYINNYLLKYHLFPSIAYTLVFVLAPLIFFTIKIWNAKNKNDYKTLSKFLKWILFFGIISIVILTLNIKYNA